jgi:polysaccharide deacetylase family protein (PEP-CTERM system associated)
MTFMPGAAAPQTSESSASTPIVNALSFDVEDYFQVSNFDSVVSYGSWGDFESRVEANTQTILDILGENGVSATFFVLGWIAERFPGLVRKIAQAGHELATHGYRHQLIYRLDREQFRADLRQAIDLVQQASGETIYGHRAPSFSVTEESLWAIDIMQEEGLRYDSSIFPIRHHRYGIPSAPRTPYEVRNGFFEFPLATFQVLGRNVPVGGGGYFRLYPYAVTKWGMRRINAECNPVMVYMHPWEFDPKQPRLKCSLQASFRHYNNLGRTADRLHRLCQDFRFTTARKVLGL